MFEDNEEELDAFVLSITDRHLQFVDGPLFQEGNRIVARVGYADGLSLARVAVIKEIDCNFSDGGDPTIQIRAYDRGHKLASEQIRARQGLRKLSVAGAEVRDDRPLSTVSMRSANRIFVVGPAGP